MKIVKPTFESLLEELDEIYVRYVHKDSFCGGMPLAGENSDGVKALVAGGINKNGMWVEFPVRLSEQANLSDIVRCLEVMVYFIQEERKRWHVDHRHHFLIRETGMCLN